MAVLAVVAYHVGGRAHGGFLGVDAFFVLSGYLITGLLVDEYEQTGRIAWAQFLLRRARRLLPALLVVLAACVLVVHYQDPITTWPARRSDFLATLFFYANWHFIATDESYFAILAGASPVRHTWSLGIEEQFYLLWPGLLSAALVAWRPRPAIVVLACGAGALVSALALAFVFDESNPSRAYFGTDTRAFELLIGVTLALAVRRWPALLSAGARRFAAASWPVVAVALTAAVLLLDDQGTAYYHGAAFAFCILVAVALWIVECEPRSLLARALSLGPLRWIGVISYGIYLWHWPLILWGGRPEWFGDLEPRQRQVVEVAAALVIAAVSYVVLERPVRRGLVPWVRGSSTRLALVLVVAVTGVAVLIVMATSLRSVPAPARAVTDASDTDCPRPESPNVDGYYWCSWVTPRSPQSLVVATAGDSTSRALDPGMRKVARQRGWRYLQTGQAGCSVAPLVLPNTPSRKDIAVARSCARATPRLLRDVQRRYRPDVWIVADRILGRPLVTASGAILNPGDPRRRAPMQAALRQTLARLARNGAQVVVVETPPFAAPVECALHRATSSDCDSEQFTTRDPVTREINADLRSAVQSLGTHGHLVSVTDVLCPGSERCPPLVHGVLARYDGEHYTGSFSREIVRIIIDRAQQLGVSFRGQHQR